MTIDVKEQFPIFKQKIKGKDLVYLDSANSSQKPQSVIDSVSQFYSNEFANVGRGIYQLASNASEKYEQTREELKKFINCKEDGEIVFTKNSTESLWHFLRKKKKAVIKFIPIDDDGNLLIDELPKLITNKTKIISVTHMSNVTGTIVDLKKIKEIADQHNIPVCVDGTQGAAHLKTDVQEMGCDFYAFSGHKMYGPTGIGLLYVKYKWLEAFDPFIGGGGMIDFVSKDDIAYAKGVWKFEAGTMPTAEVIALKESINFINKIGKETISNYEDGLKDHAMETLRKNNAVEFVGQPKNQGSVFSFNIKNIHSHDVSTIFDQEGIAVRGGHHCCQILHDRLNINSSVRVSFGVYNNKDDIVALDSAIKKCQKIFG
jgi:cysteine desulfurase/selenocysteine lyase